MRILRRIAPALLLVVLAPLTAEFLLGDLTVDRLPLVVPLALLYGCGAILVRETARRLGGGWWVILLLALAYGLLEEGFVTMSLFDPDYLGAHLLAYGFVPALGTSPVWVVYVLGLHVAWSISAPIAVAEGVSGTRGREPWLGTPGLVVVAVLFVAGLLVTGIPQLRAAGITASPAQLGVCAAAIALAVVAAIALARRGVRDRTGGSCPVLPPAAIGLAAGLAFPGISRLEPVLPPAVAVLAMVVLSAGVAIGIAVGSSKHRPGPTGPAAIALGALVAYGVWGVVRVATGDDLGGRSDPALVGGQVVLAAVIAGVAVLGVVRARRAGAVVAPERRTRVPVG